MSSLRDVRHSNEHAVLAALFDGDATRAELARALGLTRSTVGSLVEGLVDAGLVRERATTTGPDRPPGRPGTRLGLVPDGAFFLGADIAVDGVTVAVLDLTGATRRREREPADGRERSPEETVATVSRLLERAASTLPPAAGAIDAGVAVPGFLDAAERCHAALLGWRGVPLDALLAGTRLAPPDAPPSIVNDADAVAAAEHYARRHEPPPEDRADLAVVLLEHGVGLGVVRGGRLPKGRRHGANELGHLPLGEPGWLADGGHPERLEAHVGRDALLARWRAPANDGKGDLDAFVAALGAGEPAALRAADGWTQALARGLASVVALLDVERIALAGALAVLHPFVADELESRLAALLPPGRPPARVTRSRVREAAAAVGVGCLLHRAFVEGRRTASPPDRHGA